MTMASFEKLMAHAGEEGYAVGYFECWNLESLMAIADAAERTRSPVLLGFSGIYLPHPDRRRTEPSPLYARLGSEVCRQLQVPAALVFNESPFLDRVLSAVDEGYGLVMFSGEGLSVDEQISHVRQVVEAAHPAGVAVEGEAVALPGVGGELLDGADPAPAVKATAVSAALTEAPQAQDFIQRTGVDAFAVNVGQMHLHGRREVRLDLDRLKVLGQSLNVPLVLHGATSIKKEDLRQAVKLGIRKINVGSILKTTYFEAMRQAVADTPKNYNPYEVIGSGLKNDVLMAGRVALQEKAEELMHLFGSAGKADLTL